MTHRLLAPLLGALVCLLAACGGPPPDLSAPDPPAATPYAQAALADADALIAAIDSGLRAMLDQRGYTVDGEPKLYRSDATPAAIAQFYDEELVGRRGWSVLPNAVPERDTRAVLAYQKGDLLLVVVALDISSRQGGGVAVYTLRATK